MQKYVKMKNESSSAKKICARGPFKLKRNSVCGRGEIPNKIK